MDAQISEIVEAAVSNLSKVAEVNTIIGKPLVTMDGTTVLPVSQINFAFMAAEANTEIRIASEILIAISIVILPAVRAEERV